MDEAAKRENIRELVDLLSEQRPWFSMGDAEKIHENAGLLKVYDTALPQSWFDRYHDAVKEPPAGIVWCYDEAKTFGAPYALTLSADRKIPASLRYGAK